MSSTKFFKCSCSECHGHIEFPADATGVTIECPHCQKHTTLTLTAPETTGERLRLTWKFWIVTGGLLALVVLAIAAPLLLKRLATKRGHRPPPTRAESTSGTQAGQKPDAQTLSDFELGPVTLDRSASVVHADGTIKNPLARRRFSVRVELDLRDGAGKSIGTTSDYAAIIEPNAEWRFHAMILPKEVVGVRIVRIREK